MLRSIDSRLLVGYGGGPELERTHTESESSFPILVPVG